MHSRSVLSLLIEQAIDRDRSITPCIDGEPLSELVKAFERAQSECDPAGGYGGLVPASDFGPLDRSFLGQTPTVGEKPGEIDVLGCQCGVASC